MPVPGQPTAPAPARVLGAGRMDRMDIQVAIIHHLEWCVMFNDHLSGEITRRLPQATLPGAKDSDLGHWLDDAATRAPGRHPRFAELRLAQQRFHALANEALQLAREDRMDLASTLLNTDFEQERTHILAILRDMQRA